MTLSPNDCQGCGAAILPDKKKCNYCGRPYPVIEKQENKSVTKVKISGINNDVWITKRPGSFVAQITVSGIEGEHQYFTDAPIDLTLSGIDNTVTIDGITIANLKKSGVNNRILQP